MFADRLKTNYLNNPIGITPGKVMLTWIPTEGKAQTAYKIRISQDSQLVYDSGIVYSAQNTCQPDFICKSRTRYNWDITLWNENNIQGELSAGHFETGISAEDWIAQWIDPEVVQPEYAMRATDGTPLNKASYLRKFFSVTDFHKARL